MVDGLHIHIQNRMMKPLAVVFKVGKEGVGGANITNVQCKVTQNCHRNPPYNNYILKMIRKKKN
jgi:hypothetical protein